MRTIHVAIPFVGVPEGISGVIDLISSKIPDIPYDTMRG